jgi:cytosine/adenosine deaminase-related metal-dependent hydrolase
MTEQLARPVTGNGNADVVGLGSDVHRVDAARTWAPAVRGDRIVAVGFDDEVRALAGARTRVVELRGRTLLPGFQDAHMHASGGGLERLQCDLTGCHRDFWLAWSCSTVTCSAIRWTRSPWPRWT